MSIKQYWTAINAADLNGFEHLSFVLYCLYRADYPSAPQKNHGTYLGQSRDVYGKDYVAPGIRCGDLSGCSE